MDNASVLAAYDEQVRRNPFCPAGHVEIDDRVVRCFADDGGWTGVTWSDLDAEGADTVIAAQIHRFGARSWEWKHYSYDRPADLANLLVAAGFVTGPPETLLVASLADLGLDESPPPGIELRPVVDAAGVEALVSVHDQVFGGDHSSTGQALLSDLDRPEPTSPAVVAMAGGRAVAAGRVELLPGSEFAGLWGGGTLPEWRGRGVFRALVAHRAVVAAARGYRYLQVDASPDSRLILERLGFVPLATTTPFTYGG